MTDALTPQECLERARMHERLASTTADASARTMHQAMASEFRRRAEAGSSGPAQRPGTPVVEMVQPVQ
ncbi:hypothetical protein FHS51_001024 [Sphingobium wenxiniae]|uniref:Uncharacterized protein n=2 Tax=Sphingobium TaxID=165695 RepID=T0I3E8_9SPHN|nr:hypothetical protein [Sphingobium baderi]MBB6190807.1 hypothetical protein [Sphingobium wenxiniae]EQB06165.1 hypothetical protein L485_00615 [Sphingobium baderi LL03]KMS62822.1 hypothetical protein V475_06095 [Sphingobium baderi LL03]TWH94584.1 hypothetical protein IQ35_01829 [Sphingobium wenxiniae]WRD76867.1 hypothetical protein QQ987_01590 [Sphingobium baderi]